MSFQGWRGTLMVGLLSIATGISGFSPIVSAQEDGGRKVQTKIAPVYPELARRMKITGVVKIEVMVAPNGTVKDAKVVGGHPLLANAVMDAVRKWHYETRPKETTETLQFRFDPTQ